MTTYTVEIQGEHPPTGEAMWYRHSAFRSYRDAVDQADLAHGRVIVGESGKGCMTDAEAHRWAVANQGFDGDYISWSNQDDEERSEYEDGAAGLSTG